MTDPASATDGGVYDLDEHRASRAAEAPLSLVKDTTPGTVLEGTVLPAQQPDAAAPPRRVHVVRGVRQVVTHQRTRDSLRLIARHSSYTAAGGVILARRAWDSRSTARYERMMRAAEAAGDREGAMEWEQRAAAFRAARHQRRMDLLKAPQRIAKGTLVGAGVGTGGLLALGIVMAIAEKDPGLVGAPFMATIETINWIIFIATVVWGPLVAVGPWLVLLAFWNIGRKRQAAPQWAMPQGDAEQRDVVPDEGAILDALRHLSIPALNKAFKEGWQPRWVSPTVRLGNGWHTRLQLPLGVTVEMVNAKKTVLAHNLLRKPIEVWPTEPPDQPGVLDLWVADQGSLTGAVPPWPLLSEGEADYFKHVPAGVSQRGEPVFAKLMGKNYMVGGIMGSGKSSLVIALLLGAMLDRLVEIEVYVMAYNVDYDPMKPRLRTLVKGDEDEQIEAALKALRGLRDEVTLRGKLLEEMGGEEVRLTRKIAEGDPRMRPKVVVFDECHELFMHKKYGAEAEELAVKVMKKARKVGITLIWVTVSPTADSIPKDVTRNTSHGVAFAVGDHVANDGLLGTGKHKAGITATSLNPAEDIGTALTVGFTKNPFELIRSYYIRKDAGTDEITPVVRRALALREGVTPVAAVPEAKPADHLRDVADVLLESGHDGPARMRSDDVRQRLAALNPGEYRGWTASDLKQALEPYGAEPRKSGGVMCISRARVLEALEERDEDTDADTPDRDSA